MYVTMREGCRKKGKTSQTLAAPRRRPDYLRFLRREVGSLASSVLTRPKSCITRSSCRRSSWPFRRKTNSCPLLPVRTVGNVSADQRVAKLSAGRPPLYSKGPADCISRTLQTGKHSPESMKRAALLLMGPQRDVVQINNKF